MLDDDYPIWEYDHALNLKVNSDFFMLDEKEYLIISSSYPHICLFDISKKEFLIYDLETKFIYNKDNCEKLCFSKNEEHDFSDMDCVMRFEVKIQGKQLLYKIKDYNDPENIKKHLSENIKKVPNYLKNEKYINLNIVTKQEKIKSLKSVFPIL